MNTAVFLDRDGVLNRVIVRDGVVSSPRSFSEFVLLDGARELVEAIRSAGHVPVVVTNQPDIGRGLLAAEDLESMHRVLREVLGLEHIEVALGVDDSDPRRKPAPGMLLAAAEQLGIDLSRSWLVGDSEKDLGAAAAAGVRMILFETEHNSLIHGKGTVNLPSLQEIAQFIRTQSTPMTFSETFLRRTAEVAAAISPASIEAMVAVLKRTRDAGGRLFFVGSGGGAGHASHATCDFRKLGGIETHCPTDNVSELTARINDDGWEHSIADSLKTMRLRAGDCVFVFSVGGGNEEKKISVNLVNAVKLAKERGASVLGVVGRDGGYTASVADACVVVPTVDPALVTPLAESFQAVVWHLIVSHPDFQASTAKWESTK